MDTGGYQLSDLDNFEFYWEIDHLDDDAVFRPGIDIPFFPRPFDDLEMGGSAENPILLDEVEYKENIIPATPVFERPTLRLALPGCLPFGTRIEIVPDYVYRNFFQ